MLADKRYDPAAMSQFPLARMPPNLARLEFGKVARENDQRSNLLWDNDLRIHNKMINVEMRTNRAN